MSEDKEALEEELVQIEREMQTLDAQRKLLLYILEGITGEAKANA